jgi:hypothetical protein
VGALNGNVCYSTSQEAVDSYFHQIAPIVTASGSTVSYTQDIAGTWYRSEVNSSGTTSLVLAPVPSPATCDHMAGFNDGLQLAALLIVALITAATYGIVARAK